jgi:hypothetical protein
MAPHGAAWRRMAAMERNGKGEVSYKLGCFSWAIFFWSAFK